ncbi:GNAT family N-acetyltransferase [Streptomyces johnsoniae]|uniref:GNAT family N-acetyltransferase n=1 Tax=Streptomyces johnsoniae TaxID=3075532 RepID=A0ABU2SCJ8_9ACTN|nr:GNAT family N-acetyltransferase [Streptomyces sp. DSM 41886]MDT0446694.1 GNAT family N-acetyltransferase [Streptomyces sp. DSM 41886]
MADNTVRQRDAAEPFGTRRLDLVPLRAGHAEEMAAVLSDPALHAFIGGSPDTPQALRSRYRRMTAGSPAPAVSWLNWVIRLRADARLTGTVQATVHANAGPAAEGPAAEGPGVEGPGVEGHATEGPGVGAVAEVAWMVGTPWQGRGIATEAARGLVDWLGHRGVRTVIAHIHPDHAASAAVASAAGLRPTDMWQDGEVRWRGSTTGR